MDIDEGMRPLAYLGRIWLMAANDPKQTLPSFFLLRHTVIRFRWKLYSFMFRITAMDKVKGNKGNEVRNFNINIHYKL